MLGEVEAIAKITEARDSAVLLAVDDLDHVAIWVWYADHLPSPRTLRYICHSGTFCLSCPFEIAACLHNEAPAPQNLLP